MKQMARDQSKARKWTRTTPDTYMLSARIPYSVVEKLRAYVEYSGLSVTDVVVRSLREYLKTHSPMDAIEEGGAAAED